MISSLVDTNKGKKRHIAYRDSKLTFLLKDSLGGNSRTFMIATLSPALESRSESLSTLKFASRVKLVRNDARINEATSGSIIQLQGELKRLKARLQERESEISRLQVRPPPAPGSSVSEGTLSKVDGEALSVMDQFNLHKSSFIEAIINNFREKKITHEVRELAETKLYEIAASMDGVGAFPKAKEHSLFENLSTVAPNITTIFKSLNERLTSMEALVCALVLYTFSALNGKGGSLFEDLYKNESLQNIDLPLIFGRELLQIYGQYHDCQQTDASTKSIIQNAVNRFDEIERNISNDRIEKQEIEQQLSDEKSKNKQLEESLDELKSKLTSWEKTANEYETECEDLQKQNDHLKMEKDNALRHKNTSKFKLTNMESDLEDLEQQCSSLKRKNESLLRDLEQQNLENPEKKQEIDSLTSTIQQLQKEQKTLCETLHESQDNEAHLREINRSLEQQYNDLNNQSRRTSKELNEIKQSTRMVASSHEENLSYLERKTEQKLTSLSQRLNIAHNTLSGKLTAGVSTLRSDLNGKVANLEELGKEKDCLLLEINQKQKSSEDVSQEYDNLSQRYNEVCDELSSFKQEADNLSRKLSGVLAEKEKWEIASGRLQDELSRESEQFQSERQQLQNDLYKAKKDSLEKEDEIRDIGKKVTELQSSKRQREQELIETRKDLQEKGAEIDELKQRLERTQEEVSTEKSECNSIAWKLQQDIEKLQLDRKSLEDAKSLLEKENKELKSNKAQSDNELLKLRKDLEDKDAEIHRLNECLTQTKEEVETRKEEHDSIVAKMQEEIDSLEREKKSLEDSKLSLEKENKETLEKMNNAEDRMKRENESKDNDIDTLRTQLEQKNVEFASETENLKATVDRLKELENEKRSLQLKNQEVCEQVSNLEHNLEAKEKKISQCESDVEQYQAKADCLCRQLEEALQRATETQTQSQKENEQLQKLQDELTETCSQREALQDKQTKVVKQNSQMKVVVSNTKRELGKMKLMKGSLHTLQSHQHSEFHAATSAIQSLIDIGVKQWKYDGETLERKVKDLSNQLSTVDKELRDSLTRKAEIIDELEKQLENKSKESKSSYEQLRSSETQHERLLMINADMESLVDQLRGEHKRLTKEFEEAQCNLEVSKFENDKLRRRIRVFELVSEAMRADTERSDIQSDEIEDSAAYELWRHCQEQEQKLQQARDAIEELNNDYVNALKEQENLKEDYESQCKELRERYTREKDSYKVMETELADIQEKNSEYLQQIEELQNSEAKLRAELDSKAKAADQLETKDKRFDGLVQHLEKKNMKKANEINQLKKELADAKKELDQSKQIVERPCNSSGNAPAISEGTLQAFATVLDEICEYVDSISEEMDLLRTPLHMKQRVKKLVELKKQNESLTNKLTYYESTISESGSMPDCCQEIGEIFERIETVLAKHIPSKGYSHETPDTVSEIIQFTSAKTKKTLEQIAQSEKLSNKSCKEILKSSKKEAVSEVKSSGNVCESCSDKLHFVSLLSTKFVNASSLKKVNVTDSDKYVSRKRVADNYIESSVPKHKRENDLEHNSDASKKEEKENIRETELGKELAEERLDL